jgi:PhzF family phenazine biosynthesis protein
VNIPLYHLDAFTSQRFAGNPAAVCRLVRELDDVTMLAIAAENNMPATAFFWPRDDAFALRWFSPASELQLCGHATLATSYVLLNRLVSDRERLHFETRAGGLDAARDGERIALDFPALRAERQHSPELVADALGLRPESVWEAAGARGVAVLRGPAEVRELRPDPHAIASLPFSALIVTARGVSGDCDFVSRYFAPKFGIAEDSVTGSAHCVLAPYWAAALGKPRLFARQLSPRGGEIWLEDRGDRVRIAGTCVPVAEGELTLG